MGGGIIETNGGNVMKKRILSVVFAALMLSACTFGFAACGEQITIGAPQDNETEQGGNEDVTQGGETDDPQGGDEPAVRTTVTEEEWGSAFRMEGIHNVTMTGDVLQRSYSSQSPGEQRSIYFFQMDGDKWYLRGSDEEGFIYERYYEILEHFRNDTDLNLEMDDYYISSYLANVFEKNTNQTWESYRREFMWIQQVPIMFVSSFFGGGGFNWEYDRFIFNEQLSQYEAKDIVFYSETEGEETEYNFEFVNIKFREGKIIHFETVMDGKDRNAYSKTNLCITASMSFTDYGTTSVTLPEVSAE